MFSNIFNPRRRAASREFEVAICYLLHDAEKLIPLLKEKYKDKWAGFIDDILNGARPYEEATAVIGIFLQQSFRNLYQAERDEIIAAIAGNNLGNPPNLLRIIGQICYFLYLAEKDNKVGEKLLAIWLNDMSKLFAETGELSTDQCGTYLITLTNWYRDAKRRSVARSHPEQ
jgi:hypothetical protein